MEPKKTITVSVLVDATIEKVWAAWTDPEKITGWNFASDDWECPKAENELTFGGRFKYTMAAKDGSTKFDFTGSYTEIREHDYIAYIIDDGRKVEISFESRPEGINITETFEMENENSEELQRSGWQAILNNFKLFTEAEAKATTL